MSCTNRHLPEEHIANILSRLPVKDISRYRCVSSSWNKLIRSRYFIRMHFNFSILNNSGRSIFFSESERHLDTFQFNDTGDIELFNHHLGQFPETTQVLRFCNGLFLLGLSKTKNKYAIWNPSTRECKELPEILIMDHFSARELAYGFCYDSVRDDYKVSVIPSLSTTWQYTDSKNTCAVYSLKSDSWQRFDHDFHVRWSCIDVFVRGSLHWVGYSKAENKKSVHWETIISFDVSSVGETRVLPMPYDKWVALVPVVAEFEGCLCVRGRIGFEFVLWLMKDYGVKESWVKLFSLREPYSTVCPLAYSAIGRRIFLFEYYEGHFLLYDVTKRTTTKVSHSSVSLAEYANNFVENLVQLSDYGRSNSMVPRGQDELKVQRKGESVGKMINDLAGFPHCLFRES